MGKTRKKLVLVAALVVCLMPMSAGATLTFDLDIEFSGATPPAGAPPWVRLTFQDILGGVRLTIANVGLVGTEFNSLVYWNLIPSKNAALFLPSTPGTGTQTAFNVITAGNQCCTADGDGDFDFNVDFPPPPGDFASKFTAGETFVLEWLGLGLTEADFNFVSVNGPVGKTGFHAAAYIQGIGTSGNDSGWIGDQGGGGGGQVPEPSTLLLLGGGLVGLGTFRRWKAGR